MIFHSRIYTIIYLFIFFVLQILPPLKDVMHRPEEGTTLRAKLCKLLTSPLTELRDLVAEFLFILCKENGKLHRLEDVNNRHYINLVL